MKQVKSKLTGAIGEIDFDSKDGIFIVVCYDLKTKETTKIYYSSLEDLCEDWEDYEEPTTHWMIDTSVLEPVREIAGQPYEIDKEIDKEIGNWFSTKEEAEKAVEKLKAWKRLKDKGFTFYDWVWDYTPIQTLKITTSIAFHDGIEEDLDLLFSGEND